ncbi:glycosyltransferase family 4 protein [Rubripirellula sp.]|nr:glycosyltransferase family 4 protein [Rubripirellula sp.]
MKILQLVTRNELRGAEVFCSQLSELLTQRGHSVTQAGLYRMRQDSQPLDMTSVHTVELDGDRQGRIEKRPMLALRELIQHDSPDLIQANGFHAMKYACLLRKIGTIRQPIVYRNISVASAWVAGRIKQTWGQWLCRSLAHATSVSETAAEDFTEFYRFPKNRMTVIRRGVSVPEGLDSSAARQVLLQELANSSNKKKINRIPVLTNSAELNLICHVGGFTQEKNHVGLLKAFELIHESVHNCHLILFGDGPLRPEIESKVTSGPLDESVHFMGFRSDARDLVAGCDLMLLTSHIEGIPGVVLEAAARQVPSVCTNVGSVGEFVDHGRSGFLAEAGNMPGLANLAIDLLKNPMQRHQFGQAALEKVRREYTMNRAAEEFEALYRKVIKQ